MASFGLPKESCDIILEILLGYPQIDEVVIFGSRARNTHKEASDIDFAIKGQNLASTIAALIGDFEESNLIYEVDVVDYTNITSAKFKKQIDTDGALFYRNGALRVP